MEFFILYSSNTRPKYVSDILNVIALPNDVDYKFRYKKDYISPDFTHLLSNSNNNLEGQKVIIAYRDLDNQIVIPIRWAFIKQVDKISDFYTITFNLANYVNFTFDETIQLEDLKNKTQAFLNNLTEIEKKLAIQKGCPNYINPDENNSKNYWITISKILALTDTFKDCYFLNIDPIKNDLKENINFNKSINHYETKEHKFYSFKTSFYSKNFSNNNACLEIISKSNTLALTSITNYQLDSRYDSFKSWFKCLEVNDNSYTEIVIKTSCDNKEIPQSQLRIPIKIKNSRKVLFFQIATSFLGAALIALPSILATSSPLYLKIGLAGLGSLLISIRSVVKFR